MKKNALSKQIRISILAIFLSINLAYTTNNTNTIESSISTPSKDSNPPSQTNTKANNTSTMQDKQHHFFDFVLDSIPTTYISAFSTTAHFLPTLSLGYAFLIKDFIGVKQQAIGWVAVVGTTYVIKYSLYFASSYMPNALSFAKRPKAQSYEAFPSGHTSSAFAAVGFLQKRYGSKFGIPAFIVALAMGESRILLEKHTILQVVCGGILGFMLSFFCASPFVKIRTSSILPILPNKHLPNKYPPQNQQNNQTLCSVALLALCFV